MIKLSPEINKLISFLGRPIDDEEMIAFFLDVYGKKVPERTSVNDNTKYITTRKKVGLEMLFSHELVNEAYPEIELRKNSYRPYFYYFFVRPENGYHSFYPKDVTKFREKFGPHEYTNSGDEQLWKIPINDKVQLYFSSEKDGAIISEHFQIGLIESRVLTRIKIEGALLLRYLIVNDLLHSSLKKKHAVVIQEIKSGKKNGSDLLACLRRRELWQSDLVENRDLREQCFDYCHRLKNHKTSLSQDLKIIYGVKKDGHIELPNIELDTLENYKKVEPLFQEKLK